MGPNTVRTSDSGCVRIPTRLTQIHPSVPIRIKPTLTPRTLVTHPQGSDLRYVYADPEGCNCVYIGDEQAYQQYQKLAVEQRIADEARLTAQMNQDAAMNWGMWGPYPWWP